MAENETIMNEETTPEFDPIEEIKKLKENSVSKEEYNKLKAENGKLMKTLIEGGQIQDNNKTTKTSKELREELFGSESLTNLEYCTKVMELRDAVMAEGGNDPFLPFGLKISPTREDMEAAERLATVLKDTIEYANGDSQLFTAELQRVTRDVRR